MSVTSGEMNSRVEFYTITTASDSTGGQTSTATLLRSMWAKVTKLRMTRGLESGKIINNNEYEVIIRYNADFTPSYTQIINYNSRDYTIVSIEDLTNFYKIIMRSQDE